MTTSDRTTLLEGAEACDRSWGVLRSACGWVAALALVSGCTSSAREPAVDSGVPKALVDAHVSDSRSVVTRSDASPTDATRLGADGTTVRDAVVADAPAETASYRNPLVQPFGAGSIWNTPVGSAAAYVRANIVTATGRTIQGDGDVIVLTPTAPTTEIVLNTADWNPSLNRCTVDGGTTLFHAPMPESYVQANPAHSTPNSGLAILLPDQRTIAQTQPFARCTAGQPGTSHYLFPEQDLYGDGILGAHGGSGLSAIGGTLRVGELRPNGPPPAHALKLELFAAQNYYNDGQQADCYRWPAVTCDGYFNTTGTLKYGGTNPSLRPGSLLALPPSVDLTTLALMTQPAQLLAQTLRDFGAYLVDDTAGSVYAMCVEDGEAGSFETLFENDWGFSFTTTNTSGAFAHDIQALVSALEIVDNNSASTPGGGGTPLVTPPLPLPPVAGD